MNNSERTAYVVLNENTLGYLIGHNGAMGVLAGNKHGYDPKNGPIGLSSYDNVRPATLADFERFRVDATGHLEDACPPIQPTIVTVCSVCHKTILECICADGYI